MAENKTGRFKLSEKDFVDVVDADGNALPSVPKHWGEDQLPAGAETKSGRSSSGTAKTAAAKKTTAKKAASAPADSTGGSDGGTGDGAEGDSGS